MRLQSRAMGRRRFARCLVVAVIAVLGAGCGGDTLKADEVTEGIATQFRDQGVELREVRCPDDIDAEVGAEIACTGINEGGIKLFINGSVSEIDGDRARYRVEADGGEAPGDVVAEQAREILRKEVGRTAPPMTCPDTVRVPTDPTVTCRLGPVDGDVFDADVSIGADGRFEVQVAEEPRR